MRRLSVVFQKSTAEGARALEARFGSDLVKRPLGLQDQAMGITSAQHIQIMVKVISHALIENARKIGLVIAEMVGK